MILNKWKKIGYGFGNLGQSITYFIISFYYLHYLNKIVSLHIIISGIIIVTGKLLDTVIAPWVGLLSDNIKTRWGKKKVFLIFGAVPYGISFFSLWTIQSSFPQLLKIILAFLSFFIYCITHSMVSVSYKSMVPSITQNYDDRTSLNVYRTFFSTLGILIGSTSRIFVDLFTNQNIGLIVMGAVFGITCIITTLLPVFSVKENISYKYDKPFLWKDIFIILKCKPFMNLAGMFIFTNIGITALSSSFIYYSQYILNLKSFIGLLIYTGGLLLAVPLWRYLDFKYEKKYLLIFSVLFASLILIISTITIDNNLQILFLFILFLLGLLLSSLQIFPYSLLPDVINYFELQSGKKFEAIFYGAWILIHNSSGAIGPLLVSLIIWFGEKLLLFKIGVKLSFGIMPALFLIIGIILLINYPITKQKYNAILEKLRKSVK